VPDISFRGSDRTAGAVHAIAAQTTADGNDRWIGFFAQGGQLYLNVERLTMELWLLDRSSVSARRIKLADAAQVLVFFPHGIILRLFGVVRDSVSA
jgi:hypothetical protein